MVRNKRLEGLLKKPDSQTSQEAMKALESLARAGVTVRAESAIRLVSANPYPDEHGTFLLDSLKGKRPLVLDYSSESRKDLEVTGFEINDERVCLDLSDHTRYMIAVSNESGYFAEHGKRGLGQVSMEEYQKMLDRIKG